MELNNTVDKEYFRLINLILEGGRLKKNRTGIDTTGVFGAQAKFDVNMDAFPILTTKKVFFKGIVHELLWFIRGDTNIKYLVDNDVHIWDEWAYKRYSDWWDAREKSYKSSENLSKETPAVQESKLSMEHFIEKIKFDTAIPPFYEKWGELGEGTYGGMWRAFPFFTSTEAGHYPKGEKEGIKGNYVDNLFIGGVDQITMVINKLKTNPDDRRMIVSAWHPYWVDHCALPPCHCMFHFNTEELTVAERVKLLSKEDYYALGYETKGQDVTDEQIAQRLDALNIPKRKLNCLLYQRSCDTFLGVPFNITSYALLTAMVAHCVNMVPGVFTHTYGDLHIYENHKEQVKLQMTRDAKPLPKLWLNPNVKNLFDFKFEDIKLIGYDPHPAIKGAVAV